LFSFIRLGCRWTGGFEGPELNLNAEKEAQKVLHQLNHGWDKEHISGVVFNALLNDREDLLTVADSSMCYGCFLSSTTEKIDCGHSFCLECFKLMRNYHNCRCLLCDQLTNWKDTRLAGYRILSLDGGGVRGYTEAIMLNRIEEILSIPIPNLFDLIVGTSSGAIIAALLSSCDDNTVSSPQQFLELTKDALKSVFITGKRVIPFRYKYYPKYFDLWTKTVIGTKKLLDSTSVSSLKVGITSCLSKRNSKFSPVLFTSYEREIMETDDPIRPLTTMTSFTLFDAIRASFASGLYFKRFISAGLGFFDGDLRNLNPSLTALEEAKRIYSYQCNKTCDLLVSLGCGGQYDKKSRCCLEYIRNSRVSEAAADFIEPEETWEKVKQELEPVSHDNDTMKRYQNRCFRLNPFLSEDISPDAYEKLSELEEATNQYLSLPAGKEILYLTCAKLLSSLFFISSVETKGNNTTGGILKIIISSRIVIPSITRTMIGSIRLYLPQHDYIEEAQWINSGSLYVEFNCEIPKTIPIILNCLVDIRIDGTSFSLPISGCPITVDDLSQLILVNTTNKVSVH
jgi:hypothetical protein